MIYLFIYGTLNLFMVVRPSKMQLMKSKTGHTVAEHNKAGNFSKNFWVISPAKKLWKLNRSD